MPAFDLEKLRADTPGVANCIHLNNAGAALMPRPVLQAQKDYLDLEAAIGGYEAAAREAGRLDGVYDSIARLIGAQRDEIALMENATVAWDMAFYALDFAPGDRILTARAEYAANYVAYLQTAKRQGVAIEVIPNDASGALDPAALEAMIDARVKLISVTWVPTNGGLINPAAAIGAVARRHRIPYLLDACQAAGQLPIDVAKLGCDFLTATGRKFLRGPRGTGFLYLRRAVLETLEPPMIDHFAAPWTGLDSYRLRDDARRFETWENNYAARLGLGIAADYAMGLGLEPIRARCAALSARLRQGLRAIGGVTLRDIGSEQAAIISFSMTGLDARSVKARLAEQSVNANVSGPGSTLLDARARGLPDLVRLSPHYYNSEAEIDRVLGLIEDLA